MKFLSIMWCVILDSDDTLMINAHSCKKAVTICIGGSLEL